MKRRDFLFVLALSAAAPWAHAGVLDGITGAEAVQALRDSLSQGARAALAKLGRQDGYFANPQVKIGLPRNFAKAERYLRAIGQGKKVDELVLAMNRAAEQAAPKAEALVLDAVRKMTVQDAKAILTGGNQSVTEYFRKATEAQLAAALMPSIQAVTAQSGLARAYDALAAKLAQFGVKSDQATVEQYVNSKALDGIYAMVGAEERALRANPAQYAGGVVGKVFDLIK